MKKIYKVIRLILVILLLMSFSRIYHYGTQDYIKKLIVVAYHTYNADSIGLSMKLFPYAEEGSTADDVIIKYGLKSIKLPKLPKYINRYEGPMYTQLLYIDKDCLIYLEDESYRIFICNCRNITIECNTRVNAIITPFMTDDLPGTWKNYSTVDVRYDGKLKIKLKQDKMTCHIEKDKDGDAKIAYWYLRKSYDTGTGKRDKKSISLEDLAKKFTSFEVRKNSLDEFTVFLDVDGDDKFETECEVLCFYEQQKK
ncbi:MAG: hypothetical protein ACI4GD_11270 [Lachnospiraceae bacterium]